MTLAIGVDGGGTLTRAVVVDERGAELGRAETSGAVLTPSQPGAAAAAVSRAVHAAADRAGVALPGSVLWAGLSGAGREPVRLALLRELEGAGLADRIHVGTDVEAAFHSAFPEGPGILLIAGTGSIALARNVAGEVGRVGGWGQELGDEGSGYAIGIGALKAVVRAEDGRAEYTGMREAVLDRLGLGDPGELIPWVASATKGAVAALVPVVTRASAEGDPAAAALLAGAVADLEGHLATIVERMGPWPDRPGLVLWGGLIDEGGPLRKPLADALGRYPVEVRAARVDPPVGAAAMALALLGRTAS